MFAHNYTSMHIHHTKWVVGLFVLDMHPFIHPHSLNLHVHTTREYKQTRWLDYIFGICKPDQRIGKRGSRYSLPGLAAGFTLPLLPLSHFSANFLFLCMKTVGSVMRPFVKHMSVHIMHCLVLGLHLVIQDDHLLRIIHPRSRFARGALKTSAAHLSKISSMSYLSLRINLTVACAHESGNRVA
jgi:hypothetical protein